MSRAYARRTLIFISTSALVLLFQNCSQFTSSSDLASSRELNSAADLASGLPPVAPDRDLPAPIRGSAYKLTFEDDFKSLDTISSGPTGAGFKWWNGVKQCCMVDSNRLRAVMFPTKVDGVAVNPYSLQPGGGLNILLTKRGDAWFSGVLTSVDRAKVGFTQKYGYFEIRAQMPKGLGVWPAFWMLSTDPELPGEIDILEYYGVSQGLKYSINLHDWRNKGDNDHIPVTHFSPRTPDLTEAKHVFGFLWTETKMTFFLDGARVWQVDTPEVMKQPYYILINNGLGGGWPTDETPVDNVFAVDYVRAYAP